MKPLQRLIAEVEGRPLPKRDTATVLREARIKFREPVGVGETMEALDALGMWEDLGSLVSGHSYNADVIEAGREEFIVAFFAALGIREAS